MKKRLFAIVIHLLYWAPHFYWLFNYKFTLGSLISFNYIFSNAVQFTSFYLFYFLIVPQFFYKRKLLGFLVYSVLAIVVLAFFFLGIAKILTGITYFGITDTFKFSGIYELLEIIAFSVIPAAGIKTFVNWFAELQYKKQLERKNTETELALLKAQINPHFLFNTLNNIDILIEQDAKTASVYLKKLSDILRFMLYESPTESILLTQEIDYIKEYIELQKIRTSNVNFVKFNVEGNTDNLHIAPMLFIPFIENAFKHSTDKKVSNAIEIDIAVKDKEIYFMCSNAMDISAQLTQPKSGLGLDLIKNRLKLLYKEDHQLKIDRTNERFTVTLTVKLHDN